jgi:7,8-dihydropterin-6-yl-methyl-4-(beta-D-ribofuranosyl)aminobenzene 5'-phosphate synthase
MRDDQALAVETARGLFVLLGCSHSGVVNTLNYIMERTGKTRIHTVLGGTHLGPIDGEEAERSIEALARLDIGRIGVSHCTGTRASLRLREVFGDRFFSCHTGDVVQVR